MSETTSTIDSFSSEVSTHSSSEEESVSTDGREEGESDEKGVEYDVQNITHEG